MTDFATLLIESAIKGSVILAAAALAIPLTRRCSSSFRHMAILMCLLLAAATPALLAAMPQWHVLPLPHGQSAATDQTASSSSSTASRTLPSTSRAPLTIEGAEANLSKTADVIQDHEVSEPNLPHSLTTSLDQQQAAGSRGISHDTEGEPMGMPLWCLPVVVGWAAGVSLCALPLLFGHAQARRVLRQSGRVTQGEPVALLESLCADMGVWQRVSLYASSDQSMPMTWGVLRPVILLPADSLAWSPQRLRLVLLHELAHIKRRDCMLAHVAYIARAALWFNPLAWLLVRRLRIERELAADDLVLHYGSQPTAYAEQLLQIASCLNPPGVGHAASIALVRPSTLESRLRAILDVARNRRAVSPAGAGLMFAVLAIAVAPLAMIQAQVPSETIEDPAVASEPGVEQPTNGPEANASNEVVAAEKAQADTKKHDPIKHFVSSCGHIHGLLFEQDKPEEAAMKIAELLQQAKPLVQSLRPGNTRSAVENMFEQMELTKKAIEQDDIKTAKAIFNAILAVGEPLPELIAKELAAQNDFDRGALQTSPEEHLRKLASDYALEEGEDLRVVFAPFSQRRGAFADAEFPYARGSHNIKSLGFWWDGESLSTSYMQYPPVNSKHILIGSSLQLPWYQMESLDQLDWAPGESDWIVRKDLPIERALAAFAKIYTEQTGKKLRFTKRSVTRPCLFLDGKINPLPREKDGFSKLVITLDRLSEAELEQWRRSRPKAATHRFSSEGAGEAFDTPILTRIHSEDFHSPGVFYIGPKAQKLSYTDKDYRDNLRKIAENLKAQFGGEWRIEDRTFDVWRPVFDE